ncbi:single-stranded-DNA-specific exonuclease RecJ [Thiorhodovibrio frisius]|uniref:Single-stranded-DNA-specific exonuclease RecJ n=1 Tax=Thiorhodovibrio frisius TaxID=631362 RepID=H8YY60_9GAMM|nr:single-stranded-DNA-specific exonuclease RecJ [Thiorhodovibrio frisius]EIC23386.1 single-stranded-DNA-specific exonuclease RecJ [Thiorhodovibrio frisius]WPL23533.1 Single-stranded-DNA-specific exonuclease RecJ [Thiorhodovibrio frisius]
MPNPTLRRRSRSTTTGLPVRIRRRTDGAGAPRELSALLHSLYRNRGACRDQGQALADLHPADQLLGVQAAAELLAQAVTDQRRILVVGDYDADGATGSAVALLGLRALGAGEVDHLTPSRFADGYGLSPSVVDAAALRAPELIITVDNGIASLAGVERANALGIPVLITDHHLPGERLPAAAAIVNPNQPDCDFPSKALAGVGVIFYLLAATRTRLRAQSWFDQRRPEPNLAELLDLVALGTVADVVLLDHNNRILVEQGLKRIRHGRCRPGLRALLEIGGRRIEQITARDLGFVAGPRLNAAGRLEEMSIGVECLVTADPVRAMQLARELDALNRQRRELEAEMREGAESLVERLTLEQDALPPGLCLFREDWHQGVIGIVASRLKEHYHRPVIVFARADNGQLRGSARSVEGLHLRDLLAAIDHRHPGLMDRFGGHAMAAGVTMAEAHLEAFRELFFTLVEAELGNAPQEREILSDGELASPLLSLQTAEALRVAAPWGKGFPEPVFDGEFAISEVRVLKEQHLKLRAQAADGTAIDAIGFNLAACKSGLGKRAHLAYRLDVNDYRGLRHPQLMLEHAQNVSD